MQVFKDLVKSKKAVAAVATFIAVALAPHIGVDEATIERWLKVALVYLGAQGAADLGKHVDLSAVLKLLTGGTAEEPPTEPPAAAS